MSQELVGDPADRTLGPRRVSQCLQRHPRGSLAQLIGVLLLSHDSDPSVSSLPPSNPGRFTSSAQRLRGATTLIIYATPSRSYRTTSTAPFRSGHTKAAAFFRNSFSCRSSRTSALSFAISADSEAFLRSWSVACAFFYLATQLPTVWATRSYEAATEEMVRSFSTTSRTTCSLNSSEYLAAGIVFILSTHGKNNSPSPRNTTHPSVFGQ